MDIEKILEKPLEEAREEFEARASDIEDIQSIIEAEIEGENREELLEWLEKKRERLEMLRDRDMIENQLSQLEHAYRTAAISENTYWKVKRRARDLLEEI